MEKIIRFGNIKVPLSHSDKIYWPGQGITKGMVLDYYQSVAEFILPFLKNRPQSLLRNPNGIRDKGFFHKDAGEHAPVWIKTYPVPSASTDKIIDYIICNNKATLAYLNNLGCIEFNPWHSTMQKPDHPDYMIIDLDPAGKNNFQEVMEVALLCRDILLSVGAKSYCKTSGGTGIHVYVPMAKKHLYEDVKKLALAVCKKIQHELPSLTTLERPLKKRGKKIYLDCLQNSKGQTIASVYSLRPRPGATVSMPLEWSELQRGLLPGEFNIHNAVMRIGMIKDLFTPVLGKGVNLPKCLQLLEAGEQ